MSTPTASAVLGVPELAAAIDSCTELFPGVAASKANLQPMWEYLCSQREKQNCVLIKGEHTEVMFSSVNTGSGKKSVRKLFVRVEGPIEPVSGPRDSIYRHPFRCWVDDKHFDWSIDGVAEALAWTKNVVDGVNREDFCSRCRVDGIDTTPEGDRQVMPCKKLRKHPLPYCVRCSLEIAVGEPNVKKARVR